MGTLPSSDLLLSVAVESRFVSVACGHARTSFISVDGDVQRSHR